MVGFSCSLFHSPNCLTFISFIYWYCVFVLSHPISCHFFFFSGVEIFLPSCRLPSKYIPNFNLLITLQLNFLDNFDSFSCVFRFLFFKLHTVIVSLTCALSSSIFRFRRVPFIWFHPHWVCTLSSNHFGF